jgi:hypothetical protein
MKGQKRGEINKQREEQCNSKASTECNNLENQDFVVENP